MFTFKLITAEDRDNVLALGPWYFSNKLIRKHWREGVNFKDEPCSKEPAWVKFHRIPFSYCTPEDLSYIAGGVGTPLFTDRVTGDMEPMNYARICDEVDVNASFPDTLQVEIRDDVLHIEKLVDVKVEYQNKPQFCPKCKVFGHSIFKCPHRTNF